MAKKTPATLRIISTLFIIYGLLDIGQLFMPVETKDTIEYSAPLLGIFLLLFGAGMFFSKEWARQGSVFGCVYAIVLSLLGMRHSSDFELVLNLIFIGLFGITFWYLTRPSVKAYFSKTQPLKIHFHCPDCQTKYSALPEQSGKEGSCKNCGARIVVPEPERNSTSPKTGLDGVSKSSNQLQVFLHLFSGLSGVLIIAIDLIFAVWASRGKPWYMYLLNFAMLFIASSTINTNYIQGLTRGFSYLYLFKLRGIPKAIGVNLLTFIFLAVAYWVTSFVFSFSKQTILFFTACITLSTIIAVLDGGFAQAIERTKMFEKINRW